MAIAMGWHKPDNVAGSSAPAIMVGLFVASGGLLFGYDTGYVITPDRLVLGMGIESVFTLG
jgi:glycerol uptake facilitator-like aquaporin